MGGSTEGVSSLKIVKLRAENIKKLRAVEITPDGPVVQITGPNGAGKSSVLDAIWWALGGTKAVAEVPIRQGQERAAITLDLGEYRVTRTFTPGNSYLKVENAAGAAYKSPQALLDHLVGDLSFDPLAFVRADRKTQVDLLIRATGLTVDADALSAAAGRPVTNDADPLHVITRTYQAVFADRTLVNRQWEQAKAVVARLPAVEPVAPVSIAALMAEQQKLLAQNVAVQAHNARGAALAADVTRLTAERDRLRQALADTEAALAAAHTAQAAWEPVAAPDFSAITARIQQADAVNEQAQAYEARRAAQAEADRYQAQSAALSERLQAILAYKADLMAQAAFPVEGVSFDEAGVTYHGLPLAQASSAEQLRVSVALGMALHPTLRVIRIQDGSLLDSESLRLLTTLATTHDMQCWIESVDESGQVGVYIEDGAVVSVHGVPA